MVPSGSLDPEPSKPTAAPTVPLVVVPATAVGGRLAIVAVVVLDALSPPLSVTVSVTV